MAGDWRNSDCRTYLKWFNVGKKKSHDCIARAYEILSLSLGIARAAVYDTEIVVERIARFTGRTPE